MNDAGIAFDSASSTDAAAPDLGARDAASMADGGTADSGTADGGAIDGGTADSGVVEIVCPESVGFATTPTTAERYTQLLTGRWFSCAATSPFTAAQLPANATEAGVEFRADGRWAVLYTIDDALLDGFDNPRRRGTWTLIPNDTLPEGLQLNIEYDFRGGLSLFPGFFEYMDNPAGFMTLNSMAGLGEYVRIRP
ncbi:MAG: hypothetical protein AAFN74_03340 [Myxococcota bacterium]